MSTATIETPAPVLAPNRANAFGGIWRLTVRRSLLPGHGVALAVGLGVLSLMLFSVGRQPGRSEHLLEWASHVYLMTLVPILAFMTAAGVIRDDMKSTTVDYVLTRPVPRPLFIVFKFIAHTLCAQVDFLIAFAVMLGFALYYHTPGVASIGPWLLLAQLLLVAAFSALGFLFGALSSRYVVLGLAYGLIVEVGIGRFPTQLSRLSITHGISDMITPLASQGASSALSFHMLGTVGLVLLFCGLAVGATAALFSSREIAGSGES